MPADGHKPADCWIREAVAFLLTMSIALRWTPVTQAFALGALMALLFEAIHRSVRNA